MVMSTVLVVDDEADIRTLVCTSLRAGGFEAVEAAEGESALDLLDHDGIDVVILDLMMPKLDGWAVLWRLHDRDNHPPVIVMSARDDYWAEHLPMGAVGYLHKPFPLEQAVTSVRAVLAAAS